MRPKELTRVRSRAIDYPSRRQTRTYGTENTSDKVSFLYIRRPAFAQFTVCCCSMSILLQLSFNRCLAKSKLIMESIWKTSMKNSRKLVESRDWQRNNWFETSDSVSLFLFRKMNQESKLLRSCFESKNKETAFSQN